jgi:hypothetical protein
LGLAASSKSSFELLSTAARDDLFFNHSILFLELNKVFLNGLFENSYGFNHLHLLVEASIQLAENFFNV